MLPGEVTTVQIEDVTFSLCDPGARWVLRATAKAMSAEGGYDEVLYTNEILQNCFDPPVTMEILYTPAAIEQALRAWQKWCTRKSSFQVGKQPDEVRINGVLYKMVGASEEAVARLRQEFTIGRAFDLEGYLDAVFSRYFSPAGLSIDSFASAQEALKAVEHWHTFRRSASCVGTLASRIQARSGQPPLVPGDQGRAPSDQGSGKGRESPKDVEALLRGGRPAHPRRSEADEHSGTLRM